jgi:molybdate transport system regulatory protein
MNVEGRFWIEQDGETLLGRGRVELLEHIRDLGTLREAAQSMKMGYKAAWDLLEAMNRVGHEPVVLRSKGGSTRGGTTLTDYGHSLIKAFRKMEAEHAAFLQRLSARYDMALSP